MSLTVIIATSQKRTDWLISRSLYSVYTQEGLNKKDCSVIVIDDNEDENELAKIKRQVESLRFKLSLESSDFATNVIRNERTRHMSGTGAWNTGIFEAYRNYPDGFVSILDDDDEYLPSHLSDCINQLDRKTVAVFQRLIWINDDGSKMNIDLTKEKLTAENFYIGNPGVQGSNMFFKTESIVKIGGFDESLPNTTDRDLMIRFLQDNDPNEIIVIEKIGVNHYNHGRQKVNNDFPKKHEGLTLFYKKFKTQFSRTSFEQSLARAKKFFNYDSPAEQIVICMPLKNAEKTLKKSVESVLNQRGTKREVVLLIGNDNSTDKSEFLLRDYLKEYKNVELLNVNFGKASLNRNYLNQYARESYPNCVLIGRLDADDVINNEDTLSKIEQIFDQTNFDALICGNKQVRNGIVQDWENKPSKKLLDTDFLISQLCEMAQGNPKAELPSCNTFVKPTVEIEYPVIESAEDHWFNVLLLLRKDELKIQIDEDLIYCNYSLDGLATAINKESDKHALSRQKLFQFASEQHSKTWN